MPSNLALVSGLKGNLTVDLETGGERNVLHVSDKLRPYSHT